MSALESVVTAAIYASAIADDATYVDSAGDRIAVRVVTASADSIKLDASELGLRGLDRRFLVRKSEIDQPRRGDSVEIGSACYRVDDFEQINEVEWALYVVA